jgi:hypothetical protein
MSSKLMLTMVLGRIRQMRGNGPARVFRDSQESFNDCYPMPVVIPAKKPKLLRDKIS